MDEKVTLKCGKCGGTFDQAAEALPPVFCPKCGAERVTFEKVGTPPAKPKKKR